MKTRTNRTSLRSVADSSVSCRPHEDATTGAGRPSSHRETSTSERLRASAASTATWSAGRSGRLGHPDGAVLQRVDRGLGGHGTVVEGAGLPRWVVDAADRGRLRVRRSDRGCGRRSRRRSGRPRAPARSWEVEGGPAATSSRSWSERQGKWRERHPRRRLRRRHRRAGSRRSPILTSATATTTAAAPWAHGSGRCGVNRRLSG